MFSILIPTLNNLPYLKICIESIKKTSLNKNEILVHVNEDFDGNTRKFLSDNEIKFTHTPKNVGLCSSINTIVKLSSFSYLISSFFKSKSFKLETISISSLTISRISPCTSPFAVIFLTP